jgi:succinate dehydrogenase/fumarate reductase flavoprotein subunit
MEQTIKKISMSPNGSSKIGTPFISDKLITMLLSVVTAGVLGCFGFLWNVNGTLARMQERETEAIRVREEMRTRVNTLQLDMRDVRERVIRIELIKDKQ